MTKAELYCTKCDKWYTIDYEMSSELTDAVCPKCKCERIFFGEIHCDKTCDIVFGRGGCSQKKTL